ncbi:hypothetical protein M2152_002700 [Microbacteriaceae bacterium SG_E_30_P1]|uniref:Bacterial SCP orthologue domain-containing protein n=1 Tax=Antiquaquibacter oligotrophicus TaxID=2880260 RepID=A0ABT6KRB9_9MICO|nr:sterol carrier family protein [Antiquaquibacter oligotrophicus]MDH6182518.1 hypothetical protein [Antiquaquibacter oligotrophicus]UDF14512.1 sterol carrier family protein [Antiquaquibacter oligotrophicus]
MPAKRIATGPGVAAVRAALDGSAADVPTAVRYLLQVLATTAEGNTVEVRIPPYGAVQAIEGPRHTRGTPPNVIETTADVWLGLATGSLAWADAVASGVVSASGQRADLSAYLPLRWETIEG